jgi:hypothetical protein
MQIVLNIPDNVEGVIAPGQDPERAALEALALEGYRSERLSEYDVQQLLAFETRFQLHGFLKEHGAYMHYTMEDIERDTDTAFGVALKARAEIEESQLLRG